MYKLPIEAYTSDEWFQKEKEMIFYSTWQFVGFEEELDDVGSHLCMDVGDRHIIVVKNKSGKIQAFNSECRHRGNRLEKVNKDSGHIKCPYHSWTYDLDGKLVGAPEKKHLDFDKSEYNLIPVEIAVWKTMIFANLDIDPIPFEKFIEPLEGYMGPHDVSKLKEYEESNNTYMVKCNWKVFVENYMDGYHLPYLHKDSLNMYDHSKQVSSFRGPHWTFYEPLMKWYKNGSMFYLPFIDHIPEDKQGAYVHMIFPNIGISETESAWSIFRIIPISVNETKLEYRSKVMPKYAKKSKKNSTKKVISLDQFEDPLESKDFMLEDMYVCENVQRVMESGNFNPGPLHDQKEKSLNEYQIWIKRYMGYEIEDE